MASVIRPASNSITPWQSSTCGIGGIAAAGSYTHTVFAPSDDAFAKLPKETVDGLLKDKDTLARILKYHIVPARLAARDLENIDRITVQTLLKDGMVLLSSEGDEVKVGEARIIKTDVEASNGVIHVIDTVLMPPES